MQAQIYRKIGSYFTLEARVKKAQEKVQPKPQKKTGKRRHWIASVFIISSLRSRRKIPLSGGNVRQNLTPLQPVLWVESPPKATHQPDKMADSRQEHPSSVNKCSVFLQSRSSDRLKMFYFFRKKFVLDQQNAVIQVSPFEIN